MTSIPLRYARRKLNEVGLYPHSRIGWMAAFTLALELLLFLVQKVLFRAGWSAAGNALDGWLVFLTLVNLVLLPFIALRWTRKVLLWRLRNRLLITYIFIGVIPILLILSMMALSAYLIAGQFAAFLTRSDLDAQVQVLRMANSNLAAAITGNVSPGASYAAAKKFAAELPNATFEAWSNGKVIFQEPSGGQSAIAEPTWAQESFSGVVMEGEKNLFLRDASIHTVAGKRIVTVASLPLDQSLLQKIAADCQLTLYLQRLPKGLVYVHVDDSDSSKGVRVDTRTTDKDQEQQYANLAKPTVLISAGSVPAPVNRLDGSNSFPVQIPMVQWSTGKQERLLGRVSTRASVLYNRLFSNASTLGEAIKFALLALTIVFAVIEFVALLIGMGLTRTITRSVASLYRATQHINRADFRHRIAVTSHDQLAALETSFNSMTESLERLIAEQKEKQRLESELAIAQEVQAQLFPRRDLRLSSLDLYGACLPARTVSGDYYDFLPIGNEQMALAVGDISGKGISAALLMATIHSAVRVYEFGGSPQREALIAAGAAAIAGARTAAGLMERRAIPSDGMHSPSHVLWLLNRHLYFSTPTEKYATMFLGVYDGAERRLTYCNAGHLPPFVLSGNGEVRKLTTGGTVIGLFDDMSYDEASLNLLPGDLFVAYSDGVTEPENEYGEFGESRLIELLQQNRELPLNQLADSVTGAVKDWMGEMEQPDDLTIVLARAQ